MGEGRPAITHTVQSMTQRKPGKAKKAGGGGPTIVGVLAVIVLLGGGFLVSQGAIDLSQFGVDPAMVGAGATPAAGQPEEGQGAVEVFFTTPYLVYPDVPKDRIAPPHERAILADIDTATERIDLAVFEYNLSSIAEALARAARRGVTVRLALDREGLENPVMAKWAGIVEEAGISIAWEESDAFLHSKIIIVDERLVWVGSANYTINDTYRNNNNLLRITVPLIVENYMAEFEQLAAGHFGNDKELQTPHPTVRLPGATVENYFTPRDRANTRIADWVDRARVSVEFLAFSFTSDEIAEAMIRRSEAGVPVRGVFERRNAGGVGSEYEKLRRRGMEVLEDGNCYTMHHKVIVIDGRVVITGSYNFTGRAEDVNDENLLIIDDPVIAQAYLDEFNRVYQQAQSPTRCEG